ncbi:hypothetical protein GQ43DRAFT_476366 [Delitschia confertaspora ATCC 74209]|uniref:MIT domain-containing protein n=1 Tax=Delitschia confertaspora ATCC 74209 TaxID=1513339 RepID=A0A9P4JC19_9PLEO|nr:hypothetical protein GQ43DRAFT_476366 [Delitschia confertaspora ATCC 74209]
MFNKSQTSEHAAHSHRRKSSQPNSLSLSSVATLKRSASFKDTVPDPANPNTKSTPPPSRDRRPSSVANVGVEGSGGIREGIGNLNRWSQSTTSSWASPQEKGHAHHPTSTFSKRLSNTNNPPFATLYVSPPRQTSPSRVDSSPSRRTLQSSGRSPASSPYRRNRPRSPAYPPAHPSSSSVANPPSRIPSLPFLPATVYDPSSPSTSAGETPPTAGLFPLNTYTASTDYFNSKPRPPTSSSQRPESRNKAAGRSPLGSPPIGLLETEARYRSNLSNSRPSTSNRPPIGNTADTVENAPPVTGRERSGSKGPTSRNRSESNASSRLDDSYPVALRAPSERREKDRKTMLSRALQKANTAVLLDNAQNFEGAMEAYSDACRLLQQVMIRSSGEEDKRKLDAIRVTYSNRIEELRRLDPGYQSASGKSLPARPMSNESLDETRSMLLDVVTDDEEPVVIETATVTRIVNDRPVENDPEPPQPLMLRKDQPASVRESVISTAIRDVQKTLPEPTSFLLQPAPGKLGSDLPAFNPGLESPMDRSYMPPPLSPRPRSPIPPPKDAVKENTAPSKYLQPEPAQSSHTRRTSNESISWLDTIDESGGSSCSSSVHSLSFGGVRRKHLRNTSGATEAEFDAALDAAVEAAYDEGYEPYEDEEEQIADDIITEQLRNVELAKERVREAEREEAIAAAKYHYKETQLRNETVPALPHVRESAEFDLQDEAEEEERLLDEMTRDYMLEGFDFGLQNRSSLPRHSDSSSSGFSGSAYHSSVSSHRTTAGTLLSTVAEDFHQGQLKIPAHSPPPLPSVSEPPNSQQTESSPNGPTRTSSVVQQATSVRSRRLSVQNGKTLKIETSLPPIPGPNTEKPSTLYENEPLQTLPPLPKSAAASTFNSSNIPPESTFKVPPIPPIQQLSGLAAPSSQPNVPSPAETTFTISPATPATLSHAISNDSGLVPASPKDGKRPGLGIRKNKSSLSLRQRTLSISSPDGSDGSVGTPLSTTFSFGRKPTNTSAPLPTPSVPTFNVDGLPSGGIHLFESDIHSPYDTGSPEGAVTNAPIPLEPCPESYLLRPFWLMRCFYQTITHPRGGYLSTKLFVPRDVWRVKGVKLKNIDDKVANCDLLTAALQRLSGVDTLDADAVLEEMNALEAVLDQVQTALSKKLGNEVGTHGVQSLFKDAHTVGTGTINADGTEKGSHSSQDHALPKVGAVAQSKSYLASWRKLRSKNSAVNLSSMVSSSKGMSGTGSEVAKDSLTMATLPMTSLPNIRFAKREVGNVVFEGPNATYMSCLARLFDAAQILDQIARQVEDPGLKHSSPTHVGLELSARHAAEFFGFYVCRFVLTDITMMLDKFIKRGSEWVLV